MLDVNNRGLLNFNGNTVYDGMDAEIILYKVAIYLRLSRDDENIGDSGSIINQREFLTKHVENQANWELVNIYIDDGYTGTNFNRPSWLRLKRDIVLGKVNLVITKDLSRLGRDYIETGYYLEKFFPTHRVRYIAVNDGIDTFSKNSNNDMSPFMSVVNDMYAKDISKKVRTAKKTKAEKGEFIGAFAPYGYKKHPNDITKLIIDDEVVDVVKYIFREYNNGGGLAYIARRLNEKNIECPSVYKQRTCKFHCKTLTGLWGHATIRKILTNRVYIGELIQRKGEMVSYKVKKYISLPESEYIVKKNAHEAIISEEEFNLAQDILKTKAHKQHNKQCQEHLLSGLLYCPRCHNKYKYQRQQGLKDDMVAICSVYNRYGKEYCSRVAIRESVLDRAVIDDLKAMAKEKLDRQKIVNLEDINKIRKEKNETSKSKIEYERRIKEIDRIVKFSYEEKVNGILTAEEFIQMTEAYRSEKEKLKIKLEKLENQINTDENTKENELTKIIKNITDFENIDKKTIMGLINKIEVIDSETIKIYYKFSE